MKWNLHDDLCSALIAPAKGDLAAQNGDAFPHAQKSERGWIGIVARLNADAVVIDFQKQRILFPGQADGEIAGLGVTGNVGEDLLKDPENGGGLVRRKRERSGRERPLAMHACAGLEGLGLGLDGGLQPQTIQNGRTQFGGDFLEPR